MLDLEETLEISSHSCPAHSSPRDKKTSVCEGRFYEQERVPPGILQAEALTLTVTAAGGEPSGVRWSPHDGICALLYKTGDLAPSLSPPVRTQRDGAVRKPERELSPGTEPVALGLPASRTANFSCLGHVCGILLS